MVNSNFQPSFYAGMQPSFLNVIKTKKSVTSTILSKNSISSINGLLNNAQKFLKIYDQAIPIINQTKPMIDNIRTTLKVAKVFKKMSNESSLEKAFDNLPDYNETEEMVVPNKKEEVIANPFYP